MATTLECFVSNGKQGVIVAMHCYGAKRRTIYCTEQFRGLHAQVYDILRVTSMQQQPLWKWVDTMDELLAVKANFTTSRAAELLVLASAAELRGGRPDAFSGIKYVMTEKMARAVITVVDRSRSVLGVCGH